jgi:hypothetical protein
VPLQSLDQGLQTGRQWAETSLQAYCVLPALTKKLPTFKNRESSIKNSALLEIRFPERVYV